MGHLLTNKDDGRLFLYFMEQIEEVVDVVDLIPGRVRFPDPLRQVHYGRTSTSSTSTTTSSTWGREAAAAVRMGAVPAPDHRRAVGDPDPVRGPSAPLPA